MRILNAVPLLLLGSCGSSIWGIDVTAKPLLPHEGFAKNNLGCAPEPDINSAFTWPVPDGGVQDASNVDHVKCVPYSLWADEAFSTAARNCALTYNETVHALSSCTHSNIAFKVLEGIFSAGTTILTAVAVSIDDSSVSRHTARNGLTGAASASAAVFTAVAAVDLWLNCQARQQVQELLAAEQLTHLENAAQLVSCANEQQRPPHLMLLKIELARLLDSDPAHKELANGFRNAQTVNETVRMLGMLDGHMAEHSVDKDTKIKEAELTIDSALKEAEAAPEKLAPSSCIDRSNTSRTDGGTPKLLSVMELRQRAHEELIACKNPKQVGFGKQP